MLARSAACTHVQEQRTPIIDMLASSSAHFARLKRFIELQLPSGFPMKIDLPLVHMLSAQITFENVMCNERLVNDVNGTEAHAAVVRAPAHIIIVELIRPPTRVVTDSSK